MNGNTWWDVNGKWRNELGTVQLSFYADYLYMYKYNANWKSSGNLKYYCFLIYLNNTLKTKDLEIIILRFTREQKFIEFTSRMLSQLLILIGRNRKE